MRFPAFQIPELDALISSIGQVENPRYVVIAMIGGDFRPACCVDSLESAETILAAIKRVGDGNIERTEHHEDGPTFMIGEYAAGIKRAGMELNAVHGKKVVWN